MAQYCIFVSTPRYGSRDEILGSSHHKVSCSSKLRAAKKKLKALQVRDGEYGDLHYSLCQGPHYCGNARKIAKGPISKKRRKQRKPTTTKQRRAAKRLAKQPDYLPF